MSEDGISDLDRDMIRRKFTKKCDQCLLPFFDIMRNKICPSCKAKERQEIMEAEREKKRLRNRRRRDYKKRGVRR